jgi:hypothetical protein
MAYFRCVLVVSVRAPPRFFAIPRTRCRPAVPACLALCAAFVSRHNFAEFLPIPLVDGSECMHGSTVPAAVHLRATW